MPIPWNETDVPSQHGRTALVTGANAGLGLATAKVLAAKGARVLLACRNSDKAEASATEVRAVATGDVDLVPIDLASPASVAAAAKHVTGSEERLDLLLNNAGLMAVDRSRTEDGFETQFDVNHLGHFALTAALAPLLLATPDSRVVTMSSMGHRAGSMHWDDLNFESRCDRWRPYFQSKLANSSPPNCTGASPKPAPARPPWPPTRAARPPTWATRAGATGTPSPASAASPCNQWTRAHGPSYERPPTRKRRAAGSTGPGTSHAATT